VRLYESDDVGFSEAFRQHPEHRVHSRLFAGKPAVAAIDDGRLVGLHHDRIVKTVPPHILDVQRLAARSDFP
jgi:hypothetical protein